ncbi:SEFIR domain protein [Nitrosomonas sp. Is79A3]|uniref:SEFIR domain-containing protein n=1 Tax=Nitrosomonas sp. (strain Is79A3) TaxID=261292 RepID=UPI000215D4B2
MTKVFISYSHDSDEHREWVLRLSECLRQNGIVTIIDRDFENSSPPEGWPRWMLNSLDKATHVLCICTGIYYRRFRGFEVPGKGKGVDWEGTVITQALYDARNVSNKFIAVLRTSTDEPFIPEPLRPRTHYVLNTENSYPALYKVLRNQNGVKPGIVDQSKTKPPRTPEYLLGLLDRKPQYGHFDDHVPERRHVNEGKAYGFCIFGLRNEWPNAVRFTLSHLLEEHKIANPKKAPDFGLLETRLNLRNKSTGIQQAELASIGEAYLWKLLGHRLDRNPEKPDILKMLQSKEASHIFFRELTADEVKNHAFIAGLLLAWSKLTFGTNSPDHFLLLICESDYLGDSMLDRLFQKQSSSRWYRDLEKLLSQHGLQNSLLPALGPPNVAEDVEDWLKNREEIPEHLRSTIRKILSKHSAIPLGDLKEKIFPLLQNYQSTRE